MPDQSTQTPDDAASSMPFLGHSFRPPGRHIPLARRIVNLVHNARMQKRAEEQAAALASIETPVPVPSFAVSVPPLSDRASSTAPVSVPSLAISPTDHSGSAAPVSVAPDSVAPGSVAGFPSLQFRPQAQKVIMDRNLRANEHVRKKSRIEHEKRNVGNSVEKDVKLASKNVAKIGLGLDEEETGEILSQQANRHRNRKKRKHAEQN